MPFDEIESILKSDLGDKYELIAHIDPIPIASASIAQVHKAKLKSGEVVAIKVQKPNIKR